MKKDFQNPSPEWVKLARGCPKLTRKEQTALHKQKTVEARDELIRSIIPWAVKLANRFAEKGSGIPIDNLISYSLEGAIEAVDRWDPKRGSLTTVAMVYCKNKMLAALATDRIIKIPLSYYWGKKYYNLSEENKALVEGAKNVGSLDREIENSDLEETRPIDLVELKSISDLEIQELQRLVDLQRVLEISHILDQREMEVLGEVAEGKTLGMIGQDYGITRERVRQIRNKAIEKLQEALADKL